MPMPFVKSLPLEKKSLVDAAIQGTCILIFPPSTNVLDGSKDAMAQSPKFPSLPCPMMVPIQLPILGLTVDITHPIPDLTGYTIGRSILASFTVRPLCNFEKIIVVDKLLLRRIREINIGAIVKGPVK
jgi:hypothetical protein